MDVIDLQSKVQPKEGWVECYWFDNAAIGLARTLFHRIVIPFEPFDSGLDYVEQPEETELVIEWIKLGLEDPSDLDGMTISSAETQGVEASIYLGGAHNWTVLDQLTLTKAGSRFRVLGVTSVDFESEGVARNERFDFQTTVVYRGEA